jgi:hypothetical protein
VIHLRYLRCSIAALLVSGTASAQASSGVAFDQTITTVNKTPGHFDSTFNVIHTLAAGSNMRIETTNNTLYQKMGPFSPGPHAVLLIRDGGSEMAFINPDSKEYLSVKPLEMMAGFKKMLEGMGGSMTFDTSVTRMSVDSVGPGPTIDGHHTVHYTLRTAVKVTVLMMGQQMTNEDVSVAEIYSAPDMSEFREATNGLMSQFVDVARSMGISGSMFEKMKADQNKVRGFPLLMVKQSTRTQRGETRTSTETIESRNARRVSLPDSLFAIPAGYKSVAMPAMPGAARQNAP